MRLVTRIPARKGHVKAVTVQLIYDGTATSTPIEVTDLQLQPGEASGVVPHPADVSVRSSGAQWRNGVITRPVGEVILLANSDRAAPTRVEVHPAGPATVKAGAYRFGTISERTIADGIAGYATAGEGRTPLITERCDGHVQVDTDRPLHLTIGWSNRE